MPTVESSIWIQAPIDHVYAIAKDNSSFPLFMKDVSSLTVVEIDGDRVVSDWVGVVPQFMLKVKWRQEDVWDDVSHECRFRQISGDYDKMEGWWRFSEENGGTRFDSFVDYIYNVPTLGPLVGKVIHSIVIKNVTNLLGAIKTRSEETL